VKQQIACSAAGWTRREFTPIAHFAKIGLGLLPEFSDSDGVCKGFCSQPPEKIKENDKLSRLLFKKRYYSSSVKEFGNPIWTRTVHRLNHGVMFFVNVRS
jgi:hypothetical protein